MRGAALSKTLSKQNSINPSAVWAVLFAQRGRKLMKSSPPVMSIPPKPLVLTVSLASLRFLRCRWSVTPLGVAIYHLSAVSACPSMTGIVTCHQRRQWFGVSKLTCQNQPIGTTLIILLPGVQTFHKRVHQTRISLLKSVIKALRPFLSPLIMLRFLS